MISSRELLAAVRAAQGLPSNYALARVLGVRDNDMTRWNTCANVPNDTLAIRLAEMAGLDPAYVLASMHAQRCTDAAVRPVLEVIAARMRSVAAALAVLATAVLSVLGLSANEGQARASMGVFALAAVVRRSERNEYWRGWPDATPAAPGLGWRVLCHLVWALGALLPAPKAAR